MIPIPLRQRRAITPPVARAVSPGRTAPLAAVVSLFAAGLVFTATGCDSGSFQGTLPECRCEVEGCSANSCPIEISFDDTCVGEVTLAEVMVDGHVEREGVTVDSRLTTCSRIEPGTAATIYVRGGPWIWGPLVEQCSTPREARTLILQCIEAR